MHAIVGFGLTLALFSSGCGASTNAPARTSYPTYAGRQAELFDDSIEPAAVGLDLDKSYAPLTDPTLRERALRSETVVRLRISTVTAKQDNEDSGVAYVVGVQIADTLSGRSPGDRLDLEVGKKSPARGILKSLEGRLIGQSFIGFLRQFALPNGAPIVHFHLAPDTPKVKTAVENAEALDEVGHR